MNLSMIKRAKYIIPLIILFCLPVLHGQGSLKVVFFDVGQGDSIFIETPSKKQILIDGGPDQTVLEKLNQEMSFWDRHIDLVILTHSDWDHITGLREVINRFEIGRIVTGAEVEGWDTLLVRRGQRIILDDVVLDVLWPDTPQDGNNGSVVVRLSYHEAEFLLTGDIEAKIEKQLDVSQSDVLKVAHHGSKTSSCSEFLEKVQPKISVISVGENNYGHPYQEVLERLKNTLIYRTDEQGDIKMKTDGFTLEVIAKKSFLD